MPDYFTLDELRALPHMGDTVKYPDDRVEAAAAYIVGIIEREVGTSFVERTVTEVRDGGCYKLILDTAHVRSVTSVTVDGTPLDVADIVEDGGVLRWVVGLTKQRFATGFHNVTIVYKAGYSAAPPADIKEAALKGTRAHLLATGQNTAMDDRRTSLNTEAGTISFTVAGADHPTGYPEVDATIVAWRDLDPGFA